MNLQDDVVTLMENFIQVFVNKSRHSKRIYYSTTITVKMKNLNIYLKQSI